MARHHLWHGITSTSFWGRAGLDSPGVHLDGVVPRMLRDDVGQRGLSQARWAAEQGYLRQRGNFSPESGEAGLPPALTKAATRGDKALQPANQSWEVLHWFVDTRGGGKVTGARRM